jgi:hypothetical protein
MDLDQSGNSWQKAKTYLGPSLGWVDTQVGPSRVITAPGTYQVQPGDSTVFVNAAGLVTIQLPDVKLWVQEPAYQPATGFARIITIKDLGNAATFPITIQPFGTQTVDNQALTISLNQSYQSIGLLPVNDLSGWWRYNIATVISGSGNMVLPVNPVAHQWISSIDVGGNATLTQPAFSDISGTVSVAQGGTGLGSGNTNGILFYSGPTTLASTSGGGPGTILKGGPPDFTTSPIIGTVGMAGSLGLTDPTGATLTLRAAPSTSTWVFRFPSSPGTSGYILQTDGTGLTSWIPPPPPVPPGIMDAPADSKYYARFNGAWTDVGVAYQPLDGDLTSLAAASGTNTIYYRSATSTWSPVIIGANLTFSSGTLSATTAGGGIVTSVNPPFTVPGGALTINLDSTLRIITNLLGIANNAALPGTPSVGTQPLAADNSTNIATTAWVRTFTAAVSQPLDPDLTSLAAASATNAIYYRSAPDTWGPITIGTGLTFASGTLDAPIFTSAVKGEVPASGGGAVNFLRADGTWVNPMAGGIAPSGTIVGGQLSGFTDGTGTLLREIKLGSTLVMDTGTWTLNTTAGGGNVMAVGTPVSGQWAQWTSATQIQGIATASMPFVQKAGDVMTGLLTLSADPSTALQAATKQYADTKQPLNADLTAISGLTGTNTIYYRSAAATWTPVVIGSGLSFSGGNLSATVAGGNVSNVGTPTSGQWAQWTDATHIQGVTTASTPFVQKAGDTMTGSLNITNGFYLILIDPTASAGSGSGSWLAGYRGGTATANQRWWMALGNGGVESGSNVGSDFWLTRYSDAGANLGNALSISRATAAVTMTGTLYANGSANITLGGNTTPQVVFSPSSGASYTASVYQSGNLFVLGGGAVTSYIADLSTGLATVAADPTAALGIATKQYVDAHAGAPTTVQNAGKLTYVSATSIKFAPYNGDKIKINGAVYSIPAAGITIANTGVNISGTPGSNLAANTTYFVGLYNPPTFTPYFGTSHATSSTAGNVGTEIVDGVDTVTLIGMVRTNASAQFVDSQTLGRQVISWFNRRNKSFFGANVTSNVLTTTFSEINAAGRIGFLTWADDCVTAGLFGFCYNDSLGGITYTNIGFDGTPAFLLQASASYAAVANATMPVGGWAAQTVSEGYHFLTPTGAVVTSGQTASYNCGVSGMVRG